MNTKSILTAIAVIFLLSLPALAGTKRAPELSVEVYATCSECGATNLMKPLAARSMLGTRTNGGVLHTRQLTFKCPVKGCRKKFVQDGADLFVPDRPKVAPERPRANPPPPELPPVPKRSMLSPPPPTLAVTPALEIELVAEASFNTVTWTPSGTNGSGSSSLAAYTGPAVRLCANGLAASEGMFIESSPDLSGWRDFPQAGFQLTLVQTNPAAMIPVDGPAMFFRGRLGAVNL